MNFDIKALLGTHKIAPQDSIKGALHDLHEQLHYGQESDIVAAVAHLARTMTFHYQVAFLDTRSRRDIIDAMRCRGYTVSRDLHPSESGTDKDFSLIKRDIADGVPVSASDIARLLCANLLDVLSEGVLNRHNRRSLEIVGEVEALYIDATLAERDVTTEQGVLVG